MFNYSILERNSANPQNKMANLMVNNKLYVPFLSSKVHKFIQEDELRTLKSLMKTVDKETRKQVVSYCDVSNPPLFAACWLGLVHFVEYLVDECGADVEQKGIYEVEEDQSKHHVTPLWCAAVSNRLDVVKILTERHADVNSASDTQSTPVRSACYMTNIDCIRYLVEHGANIHIPNMNGGTCLINAVQSVELCKYLIDKGACVNDKDSSGNIALHYAIREGRVETVKLLVEHKSDLEHANDFGDDALQTASLRGHASIMNYLLRFTGDLEKKIHSFELLGTSLIDDKHDITGGIRMWKKAMLLRFADPQNLILKQINKSPNPAYGNILEPETMVELESLSDEPHSIYMLSLLIRERILGSTHKDTTFGLMYRGAVYADTQNYQKCVDLWKYALQLRGEKDIHSHEALLTLQALGKLFWEMDSEMSLDPSGSPLHYSDALEVFEILVRYIRAFEKSRDNSAKKHLYLNQEQEPLILLKLSLQMINLLHKQKASSEVRHKFLKLIKELVEIDLRDTNGKTLMHLSLNKTSSLICGEQYSKLPSLETVKILIGCGSDIEAMDHQNNTVLMDAMKHCDLSSDTNGKDIIHYLLERGAHLDTCNKGQSTPLQVAQSLHFPLYSLNYVNLKCLASRVIMNYKIQYRGQVPRSLFYYIERHGYTTSGSE